MKDNFDAVLDIRDLINVPQITEAFNAKIWTHIMPDGTKGVNIVVKSMYGTNQTIQQFNIIINVHVPNVNTPPLPDLSKFNNISKAIMPLIDEKYKNDYWTEVLRQSDVYKEPDGSHFLTIQVKLRSIQFKNSI
jgi:hypothetical protein